MQEQSGLTVIENLLNVPTVDYDPSDTKAWRRANCGRPYYLVQGETGGVTRKSYYCKQYRFCKKCAEYKRKTEMMAMQTHSAWHNAEQVIVPSQLEDNVKDLLPSKECYLRIPREDSILFIIRGIEKLRSKVEAFGADYSPRPDHDEISGSLIVPSGMRMSGKLFRQPTKEELPPVEEKKPLTLQEDWEGFLFGETVCDVHKVERQGFSIEFDLDKKNAPKTIYEFWDMVQAEVELTSVPETRDQLQYAIYCMQSTAENIAARYDLEFYFYETEIVYVSDKYLNWQWLREKLGLVPE